jgi:NTP pyrophosphatase (non-canonical NTP hydrolase)
MDLRTLSDEVEAVSAGYAGRFGIDRTPEWLVLKLQEEVGELTRAFLKLTGQARTSENGGELRAGFAAELADVLCHTVLLARHHDVDLDAEIARKWLVWTPRPVD